MLRQMPWLNAACSSSASSEHWRAMTADIAGADGNSSMAETGSRYVARMLGLELEVPLPPSFEVPLGREEGAVEARMSGSLGRGMFCPNNNI